jgi:hypothetical protein
MKASLKTLALLAATSTLLLAGCGSRTDGDTGAATDASGTSSGVTFNPDGSIATGDPALGAAVAAPINFEMFSDATDIRTGGSETVSITATLLDDSRNPLAAQEVSWSATGGALQDLVNVTDENGVASAALRVPQDFNNRDIVVTVSADSSQSSVSITTYGTTLDVQGTGKSVVLGGTLDVDFTLTAGDGEAIANQPISLTSEMGNTITPATPVTNQNGKVSVSIGTVLGSDTVSYRALDDSSLSGSFAVNVSSDDLNFISGDNNTEIEVGTTAALAVEWLSSGNAVFNRPLRVTTTAGDITGSSILFTDTAGRISIPISSPSAGQATITVQDAEDGAPFTTFDVLFVATQPASLNLASTSTRVFVDADSAEITALVRDANGNPVKGQEVTFSAADLRGGQLSPSTGLTNDSGEATTSFIAGSNATEIDAIEVVGRVEGTAIAGSVNLSVVERRLNVTIGAGSRLSQDGLQTQNIKNMVVQVADGSGAPIENASVSLSITPIAYYKGRMGHVDETGAPLTDLSDDTWKADHWAPHVTTLCAAEDINLNRTLDAGEDINGNGRLDPQDPALLTAVESSELATLAGNGNLLTDGNGTGYFRMVYPKGNSNWAFLRVTARATALGTEAQDDLEISLDSLVDDISDIEFVPPNRLSPYGYSDDCASPE